MKRYTVIPPFVLPRLSDKAAVQFLDLLQQLIGGIEHHYAKQVHRYHLRQREIRYDRQPSASRLTNTPF